jgi:hypothetical protein
MLFVGAVQPPEQTEKADITGPESSTSCDMSVGEPVMSDKAPEPKPPPPELFNKYPHMNRDEPDKREWMKDVPDTEVTGRLTQGYVARFGFDGRLLDPALKVSLLQITGILLSRSKAKK